MQKFTRQTLADVLGFGKEAKKEKGGVPCSEIFNHTISNTVGFIGDMEQRSGMLDDPRM